MKNDVIGFYGGKFLPMHKGHLYCIDTAARQCDHVVVIMFINGDDELNVISTNHDPMLSVESRIEQARKVCNLYPNIEFHVIDVMDVKLPDGTEDWDGETPLVRQYVPKMDYVYSSEPSYGEYFSRAYPEATHVLVDPPRKIVPISGTKCRSMSREERLKWIV